MLRKRLDLQLLGQFAESLERFMEDRNAISATLFHASLLPLSWQDHWLIGLDGGRLSDLIDEFLQSVVEYRSSKKASG